MAANAFRNNTSRTPTSKYIHSTIKCHVVLDRLERSTIDQIMKNAIEDDQKTIAKTVRFLFVKLILKIFIIFFFYNSPP